MQRNRRRNIVIIQKWISEMKEPIDKEALIRKCLLVIGCSRRTAEEYVKVVLG